MGGFFSRPKAPPVPDTAGTIQAQKEASQVSQFTPYGNLVYGRYNPETGQFEETVRDAVQMQESPFQEQLRTSGEELSLGLSQQLLGQGQNLGQVRSASSIEQGLMPFNQDFSSEIKRLEDATYNQMTERAIPEFDRQREKIEQRLADQGLPIGSEAYNRELNRLEQQQGDQLKQASMQSILAGRDEHSRLANLLMGERGQQFNIGSSLMGLEQQDRARQYGEVGNLLGLSQPFTQFATPQVDVAGITQQGYQNQLGRYNQKLGQQQSDMQGIGQLVGMGAMMFSDERLKDNIKKVGKKNGFNIYEFNYKNDDKKYKGVVAQEVMKIRPDAVKVIDGYLAVSYDKLDLEMEVVNG